MGKEVSHKLFPRRDVRSKSQKRSKGNLPDRFVYPSVLGRPNGCLTALSLGSSNDIQANNQTPGGRSLMTSNIAYAHLVGKIPFVAHEGCKEKSHANVCDFRRSKSMAQQDRTFVAGHWGVWVFLGGNDTFVICLSFSEHLLVKPRRTSPMWTSAWWQRRTGSWNVSKVNQVGKTVSFFLPTLHDRRWRMSKQDVPFFEPI